MDRQSPSEEHDTAISPSAHEHVPGNDASFDPGRTMPNKHMRRENGELNVGDIVLGRYELLAKLGSGAMGVVFKCRDQVSQVEYALKMVPPELTRDTEVMESIRENFKLIHGLKHPNIASVDFLDRDELGAYFLIMEYVQGTTLSQWIKRKWNTGQPETDEVHAIVKQIASALDYAHRKRILHRDIKPANVMVDENGEVKVLDFGLASKVRNSLTAMSINPANAGGTPGYLAPEQFKGKYPTPAADQYALGVLAYQMLAGHLPFDSDDYNVLRSAVVSEDPDPVDGLSRAANDCLLKVLNKDPKLRFTTCVDFADELESAFGKPDVDVFVQGAVHNFIPDDVVKTTIEEPQKVPTVSTPEKPVAAEQNRKAAENGDAEAQYDLGKCYFDGNDGTQDLYEAVKWFRKAAKQGHAEAQYRLGDCYYNGVGGVSEDVEKAIKWYRKAAEQGNTEAQCKLGDCCLEGFEGNERDAAAWFRKAAERENAEAQYKLGNCYTNRLVVDTDEDEDEFEPLAAEWYRKAAEQGHAEAQYKLGVCYRFGNGVMTNYAEAVKWFYKAAEQGNTEAQYCLGDCYSNGNGVTKDTVEAVKWYRKAARQGHIQAKMFLDNPEKQYKIAEALRTGDGTKQNIAEAMKWYHKAAESGHMEAQYVLGKRYEEGNGVKQDYFEAANWYRKAAERGHAKAQHALGELYKNGNGVEKDFDKAVILFRQAAQQGIPFQLYSKKELLIIALFQKALSSYAWGWGVVFLFVFVSMIVGLFVGFKPFLILVPLSIQLVLAISCLILATLSQKLVKGKLFDLFLSPILGIAVIVPICMFFSSSISFLWCAIVFGLIVLFWFFSFPFAFYQDSSDIDASGVGYLLGTECKLILKDANIETNIFGVPWHQIKQLWKER